mgnify:CR=1 FL=1
MADLYQDDQEMLSGSPPQFLWTPPSGNLNQNLSPYLTIDPNIFVNSEPQYILPEGAAPQRGRLEKAFSQIGGGVVAGFAGGSALGAYKGLTDSSLMTLTGKVYRTQMLNYLTKHASSAARPCGVLMLMYSLYGVAGWFVRGIDDDLNCWASGLLTGVTYKLPAAIKTAQYQKLLSGGGVGLGLAFFLPLIRKENRERVKMMLSWR